MEKRIKGHSSARTIESINKAFTYANRPNRGRIQHGSKKGLTVEWVRPLLPDRENWGLSLSHTDIQEGEDEDKKRKSRNGRGIIVDVDSKVESDSVRTQKMICSLIGAVNPGSEDLEERETYSVTQAYDLEVIPLRKETEPDVHFLLRVSEEDGGAVYFNPLNTKVNLSQPRPAPAMKRRVKRRVMTQEEKEASDDLRSEVDVKLALQLQAAS